MQNLNQLRDQVYQINKDNGWHEEKRSFGELIALVHSEVSEALEDYRAGHAVNKVWYEYKDGFKRDTPTAEFFIDNEWTPILGKPCGIPSELADIVIRILDICGLHQKDIMDVYAKYSVTWYDYKETFTFQLSELHEYLSNAHNVMKYTVESLDIIGYKHLALCISHVEHICQQNSIDLETIIHQKLEYNKTRGYKHGGKVI